jgi:hypothetical protein
MRQLAHVGASALVLALLASACSQDSKRQQALTDVSGGCLVNSDCAAPLVCAFQRCHVECVTTRDCDGSLRCVGAHEASRVCQLEVESQCKTSADCVAGFVCGSDGACRDFCQSDGECVGSQVCTKGVCAEPSELDASGSLPQVLPLSTCRLNSDCAEGLRCAAGNCVPECVNDRDCTAGEACDAGACRTRAALQCQTDDECTPDGASCVEGQCQCACHADVDCAAGESCEGCVCHPGPAPECAGPADCAPSKQCVDGACVCSCVADRDCPTGLSCDGCACVAPAPATVIHDATLKDAADIQRMQGVVEVETKLTLNGQNLISTTGLEGLRTVGSLELSYLPPNTATDPNAPAPLAGLAGLTLIRGDLLITNVTLAPIAFNPALQVGGNISVAFTSSMSCTDLQALEQTFRAHGFTGTFFTIYDGGCGGSCCAGVCGQISCVSH